MHHRVRAAGPHEAAPLLVAPEHTVGRRVVGQVPPEVFHRGQGDLRDTRLASIAHHVIPHDASLPVRIAPNLGCAHQRQAVPSGGIEAVKVNARHLVGARAGSEVPDGVCRAICVCDRNELQQVLALPQRVARKGEARVGETEGVDHFMTNESAVLIDQLSKCLALVNRHHPGQGKPGGPRVGCGRASRSGAHHSHHRRRARDGEHGVRNDAVGAV
mmetsp:Transcript_8917/g.29508  ORF Transcript_8917/g.29508 Transcript_8917/m.29508 type:complete len:216 (+) Transcript_8917:1775-2422(+)